VLRAPKTLLAAIAALIAAPATAAIISTTFGQGYSYAEGDTAFEVEAYDGTGPALGGTLGLRVNRIEVEPLKIELEMGETFSLRDLAVHAWGRDNAYVESAPLTVTLEAPDDLIDLELFNADGHTLRAAQPGIGRLWLYSIAPPVRGDNYATSVVIVVNGQRERPQPPFLY
jgi:hypothetical protein